jgi:hypothetical protein
MNMDVVNTLLAAIPEVRAEQARVSEKRGRDPALGVTVSPDGFIAGAFPENARRRELEAKLMEFDEESLLKAEALFYFGRDRDGPFAQKLAFLRKLDEPKVRVVRTLLDKLYVCGQYFALAQAELQKQGLSLDAI